MVRGRRAKPEDLGPPTRWLPGCIGVLVIIGIGAAIMLWLDAKGRERMDDERRSDEQAERERKAPLLDPFLNYSRDDIIAYLISLRPTCSELHRSRRPIQQEDIVAALQARARVVAREDEVLRKALDAAAICVKDCTVEGEHACGWMRQFAEQLRPAPVPEPAATPRHRTSTPH